MNKIILGLLISILLNMGCSTQKSKNGLIDEDQLGLITADVTSAETNLPVKALVEENDPGSGDKIDRASENSPPLIPHSITYFTPLVLESNLCMECHLPENAQEIGAVPVSETHFVNLRPPVTEQEGKIINTESDGVYIQVLPEFNNAYFNCTQCHVPQTKIDVQIENYFTPEFREEYGLKKSDLKSKLEEGIK